MELAQIQGLKGSLPEFHWNYILIGRMMEAISFMTQNEEKWGNMVNSFIECRRGTECSAHFPMNHDKKTSADMALIIQNKTS